MLKTVFAWLKQPIFGFLAGMKQLLFGLLLALVICMPIEIVARVTSISLLSVLSQGLAGGILTQFIIIPANAYTALPYFPRQSVLLRAMQAILLLLGVCIFFVALTYLVPDGNLFSIGKATLWQRFFDMLTFCSGIFIGFILTYYIRVKLYQRTTRKLAQQSLS